MTGSNRNLKISLKIKFTLCSGVLQKTCREDVSLNVKQVLQHFLFCADNCEVTFLNLNCRSIEFQNVFLLSDEAFKIKSAL